MKKTLFITSKESEIYSEQHIYIVETAITISNHRRLDIHFFIALFYIHQTYRFLKAWLLLTWQSGYITCGFVSLPHSKSLAF